MEIWHACQRLTTPDIFYTTIHIFVIVGKELAQSAAGTVAFRVSSI